MIFAASSSAYGETEEMPKHEGIYPNPLSPYAAGKLAGEHYIRVYAHTMGLDGVSLRYFNVFGPRQDPSSPYSGVISLFARWMSEGRRPKIFGDGLQSRDFTFVANAVAANLLAMRTPGPLGGEVYNVGTGRRITLLDLVATINECLGTDLQPEFAPPRGRRAALAGQFGSHPGRARLPADRIVRRRAAPDACVRPRSARSCRVGFSLPSPNSAEAG